MAFCKLHNDGQGGEVPADQMASAGRGYFHSHCKKCHTKKTHDRYRPAKEADNERSRKLTAERRKAGREAQKARQSSLACVLDARQTAYREYLLLFADGVQLWASRRPGATQEIGKGDVVRYSAIYGDRQGAKRTRHYCTFAEDFASPADVQIVTRIQDMAHTILHGEEMPFSFRLAMARLFSQPSDAERYSLAERFILENEAED